MKEEILNLQKGQLSLVTVLFKYLVEDIAKLIKQPESL